MTIVYAVGLLALLTLLARAASLAVRRFTNRTVKPSERPKLGE
jgi:hypothetical protein